MGGALTDAPSPPPGPTAARRLVDAALSVAIALIAAEILVRVLDPYPRVQVFDDRVVPIEARDGVPFWRLEPDMAEAYEDWACAGPGKVDVVLSGDSVLFLVPGRVVADNVVSRLRAAFADRPDVCFHNVSQPGYAAHHQVVAADDADDRVGTEVLVMQVYKRDGIYRRVGHRWFDVGPFVLDAAGYPALPWIGEILPAALSRALFSASAGWRYLVLTLGRTGVETGDAYVRLLDASVAAGRPLVFVETPEMSRPFADTVALREGWRVDLAARARAAGVPYLVLAERWSDRRPEELASDSCCHLTAAGHDELARAIAPLVRAALPAPTEPVSAAPASVRTPAPASPR